MPKNEVKLIIGAQDKASPVLGRVTKALGAVGGAYAIAEGARKAFDLSKDAAKVETVARAYRRLAASVGVDASENMIRLKEATAGTISELELMQKFNQAALLGLPLDRFDEMLSVARGAAQATGESMEYMLNIVFKRYPEKRKKEKGGKVTGSFSQVIPCFLGLSRKSLM